MSPGPKENLAVRIQILRVNNTAASTHAGEKTTLKRPQGSLAFNENEPQETGSSEPNKLKHSPQIGMIQPEAECG